jgi:MFS family permease
LNLKAEENSKSRSLKIASRQSTIPLIISFCLANNFSQLGLATFPALLPVFIEEWQLSNTEAGWINGIFFAGYLISVPILVSLTDRIPAQKIYFTCLVLVSVTSLGFAFLAEGLWTAIALRFLAGIGMAGTYMPGLKLLNDNLKLITDNKDHSRAISFYVANFGVGMALSFYISGAIEEAYNWHWSFIFAAIGPVGSILLTAATLPNNKPIPTKRPDTHIFDFRPVLRCGKAMGYVLAYAAHNFELFAFRSWIVAYLTFASSTGPSENSDWSITAIVALMNLVGFPASVLGNEIARRFGRHKTITFVMLASTILACILGFSAHWPFWVVIVLSFTYFIAIISDSAALTAGVVAAAPDGYDGTTMSVYSCIGFTGSFAGPLMFGIVLDLTSKFAIGTPWSYAFVFIGAIGMLGSLSLALLPNRK